MDPIRRFLNEDQAATATEYAVMLAAILLTIIAAIMSVGQASGGMWGNIDGSMKAHGF